MDGPARAQENQMGLMGEEMTKRNVEVVRAEVREGMRVGKLRGLNEKNEDMIVVHATD